MLWSNLDLAGRSRNPGHRVFCAQGHDDPQGSF